MKRLALALLLASTLGAPPARAEEGALPASGPAALPPVAAEADIDEHLGWQLDRDLSLTDQDGHRITLGDYFDGKRPTVLILAYYRCPMLCGLVLRGVVDGMNDLGYTLGGDYRALTISIDPRDTPHAAEAKRKSTLGALARGAESPGEWPFLVGEERALARVADEVGFRYAYDARTDQYAHPAALMVLTPEGRVSRYLYGVSYSARDLRLALLEAGQGKTGSILDRVILTCYHYDPAARAYGPYIVGFLRLGGVFIVAAVGGMLLLLFWREARRGALGGTR